ncbi:MAG: sigma-70 family RNA polymerase sigma factor [Clostridia bacterium]|nr:sigma-70 family RNA polymerase sigma factor [Clostridia bacterium]
MLYTLSFYLSMVTDEEDRYKITNIYKTCRKYMLYKAYMITNNKHDAEDAVSKAFEKIVTIVKSVDVSDEIRLKHFCGRIAENNARNINRDNRTKYDYIPLDEVGETLSDPDTMPETITVNEETYEIIKQAIKEMPEKTKDICIMKMVDGMSYTEIAECLDMNPKTTSAALTRIKQLLRKQMKGE